MRSVIITKLEAKVAKKKCKYKTDSGNGGNLVPINMFKRLLPISIIVDLNKCIKKQ